MNIYLATDGDDANLGTLESPIATMEEAKKRVRKISAGEVNVVIRGGVYEVTQTIIFSIADGGNADKKVTYMAYEDEVPIFSSAKAVGGWILAENLEGLPACAVGKVYKAGFPDGVDEVLTLFDGNESLERCHSEMVQQERMEYQRMDSLNIAAYEDKSLLRKVKFEGDFLQARENMEDVELRFMPVPWTMNLLPVAAVGDGVALLAIEATTPVGAKPDGMRVENDISYMNREGFFCTNSKKREIYYFGDPAGMDIKVPTVQCYFLIYGDTDYEGAEDTPVRNLHFKGLEFAFGKRDTTAAGYKGWGIQHDWEMFDKTNSLIRFRGAEECSLTECYIHSTSATAIRLDLHCQKIVIKNNLLDGIGNMGILLCGYGPGTKDVNCNNIIANNLITRCGEEIWHGHAIFVWQSGSNLISHNKIHHSARKGIGLCGVRVTILKHPEHTFDEASKTIRWAEIEKTFVAADDELDSYLPYLHARNNVVEFNEVYKVLEKIGDGSAINVSGAGDGNIIRNNFVHHISTYFSSSVMRTDDWQRGTIMENNVIYKTNISGITRKNFNHIRNNFIIDANCKNGYIRFASYPGEKACYGSDIVGNIIYDSGDEMQVFGKGYLVSDGASLPEHCNLENNVIFCKSGSVKEHFEENNEINSKNVDPIFKDIVHHDFSFAAKIEGINQIDVSVMGLTAEYPDRLRALEYAGEMDDEYDRGKDESKKQYNWW